MCTIAVRSVPTNGMAYCQGTSFAVHTSIDLRPRLYNVAIEGNPSLTVFRTPWFQVPCSRSTKCTPSLIKWTAELVVAVNEWLHDCSIHTTWASINIHVCCYWGGPYMHTHTSIDRSVIPTVCLWLFFYPGSLSNFTNSIVVAASVCVCVYINLFSWFFSLPKSSPI